MFKIIPLLATSMICCSLSFAEEIDNRHSAAFDDNPSQLSSIATLSSLKNVDLTQGQSAPTVHDLNNRDGVRSLFVEAANLPMLDIQLTFNAGAARDSEMGKNLFGLSHMAAGLMDEGTEKYSAAEVANIFEQSTARFSVQSFRDMFVVRLRVLSDPDKLDPALALMLDLIKNAQFERSSINSSLSNIQVGQKQLQESPSKLMGIRFYRALYGKHPYAEPTTGTISSNKNITPELLQKFRDTFLVAENMNIAITGQMSPKAALKLSEHISGQMRRGLKAQALSQPQAKTQFDVVHIPYNASQAHVTFGHLAPTRNDPDRLALEIANRIFGGGGFNAILMQEMRIKRGYTYGAYSSFSFSQAPGVFSVSYSTRQDQLMDSIQVAHQALVNFVNQPIDAQQLAETKAGMLRAFPNSYSSNATINAQLGTMGFYGESADYISSYPERVKKVTIEDVQNAIRKHLHPERLTFVVVSPQLDRTALLKTLNNNVTQAIP